jgi:FAD:protein FMN transferase
MRKTQLIMGTNISIDIPGAKSAIFNECFNIFKDLDEIFSTYKSSSEVSKYNAGLLNMSEASTLFLEVFNSCEKYKKLSNGYFDAFYSGDYDPSGYVKGYAIDMVGQLLKSQGYDKFLINAGGDILAHSTEPEYWNIAISDPRNTKKILAQLRVDSIAIATSGLYERGDHIVNPLKNNATHFSSISIMGPSIIDADVFATAVFAMGEKGIEFMKTIPHYSCMYVDQENKVTLLQSSK